MKTINEIKGSLNKSIIESFEGFVTRITEPKEPTDAQKNAGIHTQSIEVGSDDGTIWLKLLKRHLHIDKDFEGKKFRFESTRNDKDQLVGLSVSKYKDKDGQEQTNIDAWGTVSMYCLDSQKMESPSPRQHDQTEQKCEVPATQIPARGFLDGVRNYAWLHRGIYDVFKEVYKGELTNEAIADKSTHYLIGCSDNKIGDLVAKLVASNSNRTSAPTGVNDLKMKDEPLVQQAQKEFDAKPVESPQEEWRKVEDSKGNLISKMEKPFLIELAIKMIPFGTSEKPNIKSVFTAVVNRRKELNISFEEIYDTYDSKLQSDYLPDEIQGAYSTLFNQFQQNNERTCLEILKDQATFKTLIENHKKTK